MVRFLLEFTYTRNELQENFVYMNPQPSSSDPNAGNTYSTIAFAPLYDLSKNLVGTINFNETFNYHDKIVSSFVTINLNKGEYENNESTFYWNFTHVSTNNSTTYVPGDVLESNILSYSGRYFASYNGFARINVSLDPFTRTREVILSFSRTEPSMDTKIVALLDYTYNVDVDVKNTLEYYFTNYNTLYKPFPIENTFYSTPNTLALLESYYNKGYRYFLLTAHSGTILESLDWFNEHPDTVGYSCYSQSTALSKIPKNIYTLTPFSDKKMDFYSYQCIIPYDVVYFMYNANPIEIYNVGLYNYIKDKCNALGKTFVDIPFVTVDNVLVPSVNEAMSSVQYGQNASIITSLLTYTSDFYNSFNNSTPNQGYNFYENAIFPTFINPESETYFNNRLYIQGTSQASLNCSYLFKCGYQTLGPDNYASPVLNCLNMAYGSEEKLIIADQLPSNSDSLYFNYIYKYSENNSIAIFIYTNNDGSYKYIPKTIYYGNEEGIIVVSTVTTPDIVPVVVKPIPAPSGPKKKAIALLELTGGSTLLDQNIKNTIYYYTTITNIFEPLTILDTAGSLEKTLDLLQSSYDQGYRIFYGFTRSSILRDVLDWFSTHPDAIGISSNSNADSLSVPKNIYRLNLNSSFYIDTINTQLSDTITNGGKIYYVYSYGDLGAEDSLIQLQTKYGSENIITYPVYPDNSNLNQQDLINFFINTYNVTKNDSVVVNLLLGNQQQLYINYFYGSLNIPTSQYTISGIVSRINPLTTTLNGLMNFSVLTSITQSPLWQQGLRYLGPANFSQNTLNSLYMITSFVNNYDVLSLGSYNSCLQFNENNDVAFGSVAEIIYKNKTLQLNYVYAKDPIYGQLNFTPV